MPHGTGCATTMRLVETGAATPPAALTRGGAVDGRPVCLIRPDQQRYRFSAIFAIIRRHSAKLNPTRVRATTTPSPEM